MITPTFGEFFEAMHRGQKPFDWQVRLANDLAQGHPPDQIAVPTAAGKTASIDAAVYALAAQADRPMAERTMPLRIFFVIDRRVVVDEAAMHALDLAEVLANPVHPAVRWVAERLGSFGGEAPLRVVILRGGLYRRERWADHPGQPMVCLSTVDQVGSRILFRGYGESPNAWPIHAALTGNDALYILDEAHLSAPLVQTLQAVQRWRGAERSLPMPFHVMVMSATLSSQAGRVLTLSDEDRRHPVLGRRLQARKPARLVWVSETTCETRLAELAQELAERATMPQGGAPVVGIMVNRVDTARAVFERLRRSRVEVILLTGRMRPHERDDLINMYRERIKARRDPQSNAQPLFVVATQTLEVGANVSFDALVTELATLSALRQRFGRLDRLGLRQDSEAVVLVSLKEGSSKLAEDWVYGTELLEATLHWLRGQAKGDVDPIVDFGVAALETCIRRIPPSMPADPHTSLLLPAHLDLLVQTRPAPLPVDIAPYLHGLRQGSADVQLIWRADLPEDEPDLWREMALMAPPRSPEVLSVPVFAVRQWLSGKTLKEAYQLADIEGVRYGETLPPEARPVLRWRGEESEVIHDPREIRPGDTLLVPSRYGGLDRFGWAPDERAEVEDLGDRVEQPQDHLQGWRLRLSPGRLRRLLADADEEIRQAVLSGLQALLAQFAEPDPDEDPWENLWAWLQALPADLSPEIERLRTARRREVQVLPYPAYKPRAFRFTTRDVDETSQRDEDDTLSLSRPIELSPHLAGVASRIGDFDPGRRWPVALRCDLELGGEWHDLGKGDERFQGMLHGGLRPVGARLLAKSGMDPADWQTLRESRRLARLPRGFRHEMVSVSLLEGHHGLIQGEDKPMDSELVVHVVGAHHGYGRALAPCWQEIQEPPPVRVEHQGTLFQGQGGHHWARLDSGWTERFWRLTRRYGYWGLAWCEATVRLADHRQSHQEQEKPND